MSDSSISVVPRQSSYPNPKAKASEVLAWLVALDVVEPTVSDCILGTKGGYSLSKGALQIVKEPFSLPFNQTPNGLELITIRRIFDPAQYGLDGLMCPHCTADISSLNLDFFTSWATGEDDTLACPQCEIASDIHLYEFTPAWGFSNLGFTFWNWPEFTDVFIAAFEARLGCRTDIIHRYI
ncbi:hypothetical protein [Hymenobacter sp.]|jgi:hypothetical protein|uniref:hypothetical protein n=1 Tax=Hymenobacter sp. TaxID=1898978 RepID=UPI002EDAF122